MECEHWREVLSAQLDGEETRAERDGADAHLTTCADCRRWLDGAAAVTRRARLSVAAPPADLTAAILAAVPAPRASRHRSRLVVGLRTVLGLIGALQLVLGLAQIGRGPGAAHDHAATEGILSAGHLWHEAAAWNVAIGAGFLFVAARRTPSTGLLPMLTAFVGTLVLLSVNDLVTGRVDPARLVSHGFLIAGYAIVAALSRPRLRPGGPPSRRPNDRPGWRLPAREESPTPPLRVLPPPHPGSARVTDRPAA
ncbi:zf-HC2 domain-containing protein [Micromonospora sp. URMC 103]|uniref:zf-HC2 domain-containing protein n=1 Tax=Micromonospora sp. URMC 103 TaxID=3423406 RepID=UPI003F1AC90F